jgi:hypothetical protein
MNHPLDNAIIFGSLGMGEVIQITPLIAALRSPTLVVKDWHVPVFDRLGWDVRTLSPGNYRPGRTIELTRADADTLGLDHRPCIAPLVRGGVFIDGEPAPTLVPGVMGRCPRHLSLSEKTLAEYGVEGSAGMHVSRIAHPDRCRTLTIASSGEELRTVPPHVILGLVRRISGWQINIIGSINPSEIAEIEAVNGGRNEITVRYPASLTPGEFEAVLATVQRSHVVVATDCGWAYAALASGIKTYILQSHVLFETLVPRAYWGPHGLAEPVGPMSKLSCDRQCSAQRLLAAMPPGVARPYAEFEDYRHMTPDWRDRYYISGYPRTLACWGTINPPCMDYDEATLDRLATQVLDAPQP